MKKQLIIFGMALILISLAFVMSASFTPQGSIDLKNIFNITNVPYINGINFTAFYNNFISSNSSANARIDSVNSSLQTQIGRIDNINSTLNSTNYTLQTNIDGANSRINSVNSTLNSVNSTLQGNIDSANNRITSVNGSLNSINSTLQGNIDTANSRITSVNTTINGRVDSVNSSLQTQTGRIDTINSTIVNNNASWSSTYNSTYQTWAYNQTTPAISDINSRFWNKTDSYNDTQIDSKIINNASYFSTFNTTYANYVNANVSNSTTWWATISGYVTGWFSKNGNNLDFNETKLNNSIANNPKNWTSLQNFPLGCPADTFVTNISGSTTCSSVSASNSSSFWAGISSFISKWFYNSGNSLTFNETQLNSSIDSRTSGKLDTNNLSDNIENINGVSSEGLWMYYPFDSNVNDYSGHSNTILNKSGAKDYINAKMGNGYNFSGSNYLLVTVPGNTSSTLTGCAWNQPSQAQNLLALFATRHGDTGSVNGFVISRNALSGTAYALLHNSSGSSVYEVTTNLPSKFNNTNMQLWCLTTNNTNINIYINGENITNSPSIAYPINTGTTVAIGVGFYGATNKYNGTIDEVMFWNRSLSSYELKSLYESNKQLFPLTSFYTNDQNIDTGNKNITTNNIIINNNSYVNSNSYYCLDGLTCSHRIYYNGSATIIE